MRALIVAIVVSGALQLVTQGAASAAPGAWTGTVAVARADVHDSPGGEVTGTLESGTAVAVTNWVYGPQLTTDNYTWADLGDGRFIHSSMLRHSPLPGAPPVPPQIVSSSHWADANLTLQILTLYEGDKPVRMSLMNSGRPGPDTESHTGTWSILRRVADETMRGDGYDIAGVLFTQYFTDDAEAIHL